MMITGIAYGSGIHRDHLEASQYRSLQIVTFSLHIELTN